MRSPMKLLVADKSTWEIQNPAAEIRFEGCWIITSEAVGDVSYDKLYKLNFEHWCATETESPW